MYITSVYFFADFRDREICALVAHLIDVIYGQVLNLFGCFFSNDLFGLMRNFYIFC